MSISLRYKLGSLPSWMLLIIVQLVVGALFCLVRLAQAGVTHQFLSSGYDSILIAMLPAIFDRYMILVPATTWTVVLAAYLMRSNTQLSQLRPLTIVCLTLFGNILLLTRSLQFPVSIDDSYIDYRYVRNALHGLGLHYNPGDCVIGFTSYLHLWILLFWGSIFRGVPVPFLSQTFNILVEWVTFYLGFITFKQIYNNQYIGLLFSVMMTVLWSLIELNLTGKEGSLVILLLVLGMLSIHLRRTKLLAWVGALAFLARPEGFICMLISAAHSFTLANWKEVARSWALPLLVVSSWYLFMFLSFGTVLPHGAVAKAIVYPHEEFGTSLCEIMLHLSLPVNCLGVWWRDSFPFFFLLEGLAMLGVMAWFFRAQPMKYYNQVFLGELFFFTIVRAPMVVFPWYFCWFELSYFLVVMCLCAKILERRKSWAIAFAIAMIMQPLVVTLHLFFDSAGMGNPPVFAWNLYRQRLLEYERVAEYLNNSASGDRVASVEVGMLGYAYEGQILDLLGLISPEVLKFYPVPASDRLKEGSMVVSTALVQASKPPFLLMPNVMFAGKLLKNPDFVKHYQAVKSWSLGHLWSDDTLVLFKRSHAGESVTGSSPQN